MHRGVLRSLVPLGLGHGLSLLRKAWINLDLIWSGALIATGCFVLLV
jgi:hypothetical protein